MATTASSKDVYVLYGSQTGNSEFIAKDFAEKLTAEDIPNKCLALNSIKKVPMQDKAMMLIIVVATTGNGDSPENSDGWWRSIKLRSAAKDMFSGIPFAVLGLGDTNYDKYCYMGKMIDKRLGELGGERCLDIHCADEGTGLEETVEVWKSAMYDTVKAKLASLNTRKEDPTGDITTAVAKTRIDTNEGPVGEQKEYSEKTCDASIVPNTSEKNDAACVMLSQQLMPTGIQTVGQIASALGYSEQVLSAAVDSNQLPRVKACCESKCCFRFADASATLSKQPEAASKTETSVAAAAVVAAAESKNSPPRVSHTRSIGSPPSSPWRSRSETEIVYPEWSSSQPFEAMVVGAKWLTSNTNTQAGLEEANTFQFNDGVEWGSTKRVIHMELDLEGSGITYLPGDSIGICCPNAPYAVEIVLRRLQDSHPDLTLTHDTLLAGKSEEGVDKIITLGETLSYKFDLMGPPRKSSVAALANYCTDETEKVVMQHLCSKGLMGKALWAQFTDAQQVGMAELLALFPSCRPSLSQLLPCLVSLPPRYYSISSSPLGRTNRLSVAFSVVRNTCTAATGEEVDRPNKRPASRVIKRGGLCTTFLERILQPWLLSAPGITNVLNMPVTTIRIFHKTALHFHLPGSVAPPLLLIGPGTGVAPFMGFLEHRALLEADRQSTGGEDVCTGMWRGGFDLEPEDLPGECGCVEGFIQSVPPGPIHLFFGCRTNEDFLYRAELDRYVAKKTLTSLDVAMSRTGAEKVYVSHKMDARREEIAKLILEDGASVYICGDGNYMARDVHAALKAALLSHPSEDVNTEEEVDNYLADMKIRRRYVLDIWS